MNNYSQYSSVTIMPENLAKYVTRPGKTGHVGTNYTLTL